jgi:hypothetical protein
MPCAVSYMPPLSFSIAREKEAMLTLKTMQLMDGALRQVFLPHKSAMPALIGRIQAGDGGGDGETETGAGTGTAVQNVTT